MPSTSPSRFTTPLVAGAGIALGILVSYMLASVFLANTPNAPTGATAWVQPLKEGLASPQVAWQSLSQWLSLLVLPNAQLGNNAVFNAQAGITQPEARSRYQQAVKTLTNTQTPPTAQQRTTAIATLNDLLVVMPALAPIIHLHLAQAYQGVPDEGQVQHHLEKIRFSHASSPLQAVATYKLAQSHFRGKQPTQAKALFYECQRNYPLTQWATGSHYYLSQLAQQEKQTDTANEHGLAYLNAAPTGTFAADVVDMLQKTLAPKVWTPTLHAKAAEALAVAQRPAPQIQAHLAQAAMADAWSVALGQALKAQQWPQATSIAAKHLVTSADTDKVVAWLDEMARLLLTPVWQAWLAEQASLPNLQAHHVVLWYASQYGNQPQLAQSYLRRLVQGHPNSPYAPESQWLLMRHALLADEWSEAEALAQGHAEAYPHAKSTPKVLYWQAKLAMLQGQSTQATEVFNTLVKQYPLSYYAMRAESNLAGQPNQWPLQSSTQSSQWLSQAQEQFTAWAAKPLPASVLALGLPVGQAPKLSQGDSVVLNELVTLGDAPMATLWLAERYPNVKQWPGLSAWLALQQGDWFTAMRTARQALMDTEQSASQVSDDVAKLLYPVPPFTPSVTRWSQAQQMDALLALSLLREESYFNPRATSTSNAMGLMQLLPSTAAEVAAAEGLLGFKPADLYQPDTNIRLGTHYLGNLLRQFEGLPAAAVGAYNGGPNAMRRWRNSAPAQAQADTDWFLEWLPYTESRDYVVKVYGTYWAYQQVYGRDDSTEG